MSKLVGGKNEFNNYLKKCSLTKLFYQVCDRNVQQERK